MNAYHELAQAQHTQREGLGWHVSEIDWKKYYDVKKSESQPFFH